MALTDAQICNIALARIGQRQFVDDLNSPSTQAQVCKVLYSAARDSVLEAFPWPFATRRSTLALAAVNGTAIARDGWAYVYALPTDCVVVRYIYPGTTNPAADQRIPYSRELADDATGRATLPILLTNLALASLVYVASITTSALWPPLFVEAVAWRMAADLALALPVKPEVGLRMEAGFKGALASAAASQLRQLQADVKPESQFVRGR